MFSCSAAICLACLYTSSGADWVTSTLISPSGNNEQISSTFFLGSPPSLLKWVGLVVTPLINPVSESFLIALTLAVSKKIFILSPHSFFASLAQRLVKKELPYLFLSRASACASKSLKSWVAHITSSLAIDLYTIVLTTMPQAAKAKLPWACADDSHCGHKKDHVDCGACI